VISPHAGRRRLVGGAAIDAGAGGGLGAGSGIQAAATIAGLMRWNRLFGAAARTHSERSGDKDEAKDFHIDDASSHKAETALFGNPERWIRLLKN
jgi:hypothetical protein